MLVTATQVSSGIGHRCQASKTYSVTFVRGPNPAVITERNWETAPIGDQCPVAAAFPVDAQKKKPSPRPHVAVDRVVSAWLPQLEGMCPAGVHRSAKRDASILF